MSKEQEPEKKIITEIEIPKKGENIFEKAMPTRKPPQSLQNQGGQQQNQGGQNQQSSEGKGEAKE